ncbi:hypothetical protein CYLTODRAFT_430482 [Cylindrobasidium torrendii FP15055 ss-10]|uniref:Uncharacterized protein n=1 Tax=Cylindrobasidium torrendii FP15055 ss-10 TaxID=1314674 RepID=A0A0D7BFP5_9AGAR|nr:hypothetical protein CYLTODRAFT_430482 [Cylindrobasidium torrendii FP15055 ss-10]
MDSAYGWKFVVGNSVASSQLLTYIRMQVVTALGLTNSDVLPYALQVVVPSTYQDASDVDELGTQVLLYLPSDQVDALASQLKVKTSAFYTGGTTSDAQSLVSHVLASTSLLSVSAPSGDGSGTSSGGSSDQSNSQSGSSSTRQDAIIGVTTALGSVAVLTLLYLVWRAIQRRKEEAHRRISNPPPADDAGFRPQNRDYDQDTIGGQRRRSFFYAEDSLRGFQGSASGDDWYQPDRVSPQMSQRRHVAPANISPPILRESSMNW